MELCDWTRAGYRVELCEGPRVELSAGISVDICEEHTMNYGEWLEDPVGIPEGVSMRDSVRRALDGT